MKSLCMKDIRFINIDKKLISNLVKLWAFSGVSSKRNNSRKSAKIFGHILQTFL